VGAGVGVDVEEVVGRGPAVDVLDERELAREHAPVGAPKAGSADRRPGWAEGDRLGGYIGDLLERRIGGRHDDEVGVSREGVGEAAEIDRLMSSAQSKSATLTSGSAGARAARRVSLSLPGAQARGRG
jgi:hypothetical protein